MGSILKKILTCLVLLSCLGAGFAQTQRSPSRAVLYSAAFPGGGQLYNRAWLKAGLVVGVQGFLIGSAVWHGSEKSYWQKLAESEPDEFLRQQYLARSNDFGDELKNDLWWVGITAGLSMLDAYVDAHLSDFDSQKEEIRLRFEIGALLLKYSF